MEVRTSLKYGLENDPWKPNLLTAFLQLVLAPLSILISWLIMALIVVWDVLSVGSLHITLRVVPKPVQMPDGTIRSQTPHTEEKE